MPPAQPTLTDRLSRAIAAHQAGRLDEAETQYQTVLTLDNRQFEATHFLGVLMGQRGRLKEAEALIARSLRIDGSRAEAHGNHARILNDLDRAADALAAADRALSINRHFHDGWTHRGLALLKLDRADSALPCFEQALALAPRAIPALIGKARALVALHRPAEAVAVTDTVLLLDRRHVPALMTRAGALAALGRIEDALASFTQAAEAAPGSAEAVAWKAQMLRRLGRNAEALAAFDQAYRLDPTLDYVLENRIHQRMLIADWSGFGAERAALVDSVDRVQRRADPFVLLGLAEEPGVQFTCARRFAEQQVPAARVPLWQNARYGHERIRLAYLSSDFHDHATLHLMAGLFEKHDRSRFEVSAVSWSQDDGSGARRRLVDAVETFTEVGQMDDAAVAQMLRDAEIDIAVDLKGFTESRRTGIFARRPAPLQVAWLGYPGTMAVPYIDYVIGDRFVTPPDHAGSFTEKIVRLPDSYQVNDDRRPIAEAIPDRAALGLPEHGLVFCCFNNTFKILPDFFDIWMRLLAAVDGSVLWLLARHPAAIDNLRREAAARGVAPERLVFAQPVPVAEHLARLRQADLMLDTLPYGAHTTASDALWTGVPVLTCMGGSFAGRVGASLLTAAGLPELITHSREDYEAAALRLARDPAELGALRARLVAHRATCALFDTDRFRRHLEAAFATMHERHLRGSPPQSFDVPAL